MWRMKSCVYGVAARGKQLFESTQGYPFLPAEVPHMSGSFWAGLKGTCQGWAVDGAGGRGGGGAATSAGEVGAARSLPAGLAGGVAYDADASEAGGGALPHLRRPEVWLRRSHVRDLRRVASRRVLLQKSGVVPVPIDNNRTERGFRGAALGRNNFYGSKSKRGTEVAAILYSLVETAKLVGVDPKRYLTRSSTGAINGPRRS